MPLYKPKASSLHLPINKDFCLDCGKAYSHCNCRPEPEPMDLGNWVDCDNTIPQFEPLPGIPGTKKAKSSHPNEWTVRPCPIPDMSVIVDTGAVEYRIRCEDSHHLYPRWDRIFWNPSSGELNARSGIPSLSPLPPLFSEDEFSIAVIHIPHGATVIPEHLIHPGAFDRPSPPSQAYPFLGDTEVRLKGREYISEIDGSRTIIETFERVVTESNKPLFKPTGKSDWQYKNSDCPIAEKNGFCRSCERRTHKVPCPKCQRPIKQKDLDKKRTEFKERQLPGVPYTKMPFERQLDISYVYGGEACGVCGRKKRPGLV